METVFGLLRKKQVAPFFFLVATISAVAFAWACKINYATTYTQLHKVVPEEAAIMFTLAIQSFEFLVPIISVIGITRALNVSWQMELGLGVGWFVVIAVDFITALQYFLGAYEHQTAWSWLLSIVLSGVFLVAEMLLVLSLVTMYVVAKMWKTGTVPDWITDPHKDTVDIPKKLRREPLFRNIFKRSPTATATAPAASQYAIRPKAKDVPDGTTWDSPDGKRTYVVIKGEWVLQKEHQTPSSLACSVPLQI